MSEEQLDRREQLMAAMDAAEEGTLEAPEEKEIEVVEDTIAEEAQAEEPVEIEAAEEAEVEETQEVEEVEPTLQRPTTWKKEYLPIWDKLTNGQQLTKEEGLKLAEYAGTQRETEFKRGVSTYKAEADRAKPYIEAVAPVQDDLQRRGIDPVNYVKSLVKADQILTHAPMEHKIQIFQQLAKEYGVQFNQEGIQRLMGEIEKYRSDVEKYPHFDVVREEMAQLLELGKAPDLETAYKKAVRMNDDVWALEQDRLLKDAKQSAIKAQQVQKAKAAAVSPRSVTPSGKVADTGDKKDRRSLIAEQMGEALSRRV